MQRRRSWLVAGATQVQPAAVHLPILAKTLPRTGTNYPRNSSQREAASNSSTDYGGGKRRRDGTFDAGATSSAKLIRPLWAHAWRTGVTTAAAANERPPTATLISA